MKRLLQCIVSGLGTTSLFVPALAVASHFAWFDRESLPGQQIERLKDGPTTFATRLQLIQKAKRTIVMSTYAYKADDAGLALANALCAAASRGVDVRVLLDGFGSAPSREFADPYRSCGIHVIYDGMAHFGPTDKLFVTHDKLLVIDGERMIMGGSGIADYYRDYSRASAEWHDQDFKIKGPAACWYHNEFARNWEIYRSLALPRNPFDFSERRSHAESTVIDSYFGKTQIPECKPAYFGEARVLPLYNNPYYEKRRKPLVEHQVAAIQSVIDAKIDPKQKEIALYGAYFVPHKKLVKAVLAAREANVPVSIITNSELSNDDLPALVTAMFNDTLPLLEKGVKVYIWPRKQTMHRKGGVFNRGELCFFGSDNLDRRGQNFSSESIAFTDYRPICDDMYSEYRTDLASALEITLEDAKAGWRKSSIRSKVGAIVMHPFL